MSRSVDLFIGADVPLEELARALAALTRATLEAGAVPCLREGDVVAELSEHGYVDDGDLWLSRYRYVLSARVAPETYPRDSAQALWLREVSERLRASTEWPALLVLDLQYRDPLSAPAGPLGEERPAGEAPEPTALAVPAEARPAGEAAVAGPVGPGPSTSPVGPAKPRPARS